jgi:hypothetical protein
MFYVSIYLCSLSGLWGWYQELPPMDYGSVASSNLCGLQSIVIEAPSVAYSAGNEKAFAGNASARRAFVFGLGRAHECKRTCCTSSCCEMTKEHCELVGHHLLILFCLVVT